MERFDNPAVVVGGGVNGLGVIRNLGRNGVDVYCVTNERDEAVYSKYCKGYFVWPEVEHDLEKLKLFLTKFERQLANKAVIFPTSDISILNISSLVAEIDGYLAPISNNGTLETLVKKRRFYQSLMAMNVPHPRTVFPESAEDLTNISHEVVFPVFIKPSISQILSQKFRRKGFVANSEVELRRYLRLMSKHKIDIMIQEIVPGTARNHYFIDGYLDRNSNPVALFGRRRIRMWPLWFGNSSVCVSVPMSELADMKETIVEYLSSIGFRGIFSAEFKVDPRDNTSKLLEVNARSWWYNSFPSECGMNIIFMAYLDAIGEKIESAKSYEVGKKLIYFREDLKWAVAMLIKGKLSLQEWLSPMIGKGDWTIFAKDDLKPFIMSILNMATTIMDPKNAGALLKVNDHFAG